MVMEIIHLSVDTPMQVHDSVCALGFFDGVHLGHQQLLKEVEHIAKEKGLKKAIMTFSVHPKQILKNNDYHYLMSLSEKINILKQWQFDYFYIIDFDQTVANLKPNTFLQNYIINHQIKHVVCGFDFHFGKKGMGDVHVLQENKSFDVTVIEEYSEDALKVSSSYIKKLLNEGNIEKANHLLTRFYRVSGQVIYGLQNGRKIGFPTANIDYGHYVVLKKGLIDSSNSNSNYIPSGEKNPRGQFCNLPFSVKVALSTDAKLLISLLKIKTFTSLGFNLCLLIR